MIKKGPKQTITVKRQEIKKTDSCSHGLSNHVLSNTSVSYHRMSDGRLPLSPWQAGLGEVVVLTELIARGWKRGRSDVWHPNPAPKPAVATDPLHGQQMRYELIYLAAYSISVEVILKVVIRKYKPTENKPFHLPRLPMWNLEPWMLRSKGKGLEGMLFAIKR